MVELFANSEDPDQAPHSAASDLGLQCLSVTLLGVFRLQWVKYIVKLASNASIFFAKKKKKWTTCSFYCSHFHGKKCYCSCQITYRIRPNYRTVRLGFSNLLWTLICGKICIYLLRIHYKKDQKNHLIDYDYVIVSDFLYKGICCGYSFELHRQVDAIQMSTHNICF